MTGKALVSTGPYAPGRALLVVSLSMYVGSMAVGHDLLRSVAQIMEDLVWQYKGLSGTIANCIPSCRDISYQFISTPVFFLLACILAMWALTSWRVAVGWQGWLGDQVEDRPGLWSILSRLLLSIAIGYILVICLVPNGKQWSQPPRPVATFVANFYWTVFCILLNYFAYGIAKSVRLLVSRRH